MKIERLFIYCLLAGASLLASCSGEDVMDNQVEPLPEGMYPLQISSVTVSGESSSQPWGANGVQTRVSENVAGTGSDLENGDEIAVQITGSNTGTYKVQADGTIEPVTPTCWKNKDNATVTAWYPATTTISLANQKNSLAYVLKAEKNDVPYNTSTSLSFSHKLAKVRVVLKGTADMDGGTIQVKGYTQGTINRGDVEGSSEEWITMQHISYNDGAVYYEANVIPGLTLFKNAFQLISKNNTKIQLNLDKEVSVSTAGSIYNITLTVNKAGTNTIELAKQENVYTVKENTSVIIDGGGKALSKKIVIKEGARVMLKNVKLNAPSNGNTIEVQGTATLILSGNNEIKGADWCPLAVTDGTLTINGTLEDRLKLIGGTSSYATNAGCLSPYVNASLIINGGYIIADGSRTEGAGIGSFWANYQGKHAGTISINGGKIEALGGGGSAGIGGGNQCSCDNIIITGGCITAQGGAENNDYGGAGIGSGATGSSYCGTITISGKNTYVKATKGSKSRDSDDDIGVGCGGHCGTVTITDGATVIATNGKIHGH